MAAPAGPAAPASIDIEALRKIIAGCSQSEIMNARTNLQIRVDTLGASIIPSAGADSPPKAATSPAGMLRRSLSERAVVGIRSASAGTPSESVIAPGSAAPLPSPASGSTSDSEGSGTESPASPRVSLSAGGSGSISVRLKDLLTTITFLNEAYASAPAKGDLRGLTGKIIEFLKV